MNKIKQQFLQAVASVGLKTAIKANGTASMFGTYQAKEPKSLIKFSQK